MANIKYKLDKIRYIANKMRPKRHGVSKQMASRGEIGQEIRSARKKLGYTQQVVSEKSTVHKTTISEIENGRFTGSFDLFEKVLNCVGLQFEVVPKKYKLPAWDEIESLFKEDDE